jgi:hypothetical protein
MRHPAPHDRWPQRSFHARRGFGELLRERRAVVRNVTVSRVCRGLEFHRAKWLKAFVKLSSRQRFEVVELVERLTIDTTAASDRPLS